MDKVFNILQRILYIIGGIFFCFTVLLVVLNVILRSAINFPIPGAYELTGWGTAFFAAVAIPIATLRGTHIRVDILVSRFRGVLRLICEFIATIFDVFFASVISYAGFEYAIQMLIAGESTPSLAFPIGPARLLWAISAVVMVLANLRKLVAMPRQYLQNSETRRDRA